ncbi:MAG: DNA mismatch repair endonuclease MutL, partial [Pirellulales bacterium]
PADSRKGRIRTFFGDDLADGLIKVYGEDEELRVSGYVADPSHSRGNNRMQFLFLNGRFIRDRSLQHALNEAYRGLLMTGRYPICFLTMQMPAEMVDVNVHPTKLEVRFQDGGRIYSHLLGTLRTQFLNTDLTAKVQTGTSPPSGESGANPTPRPTDSGSPFALPTALADPNAGDETSPAHVSEFRLPAHVVQGLTTESHPLSNPHALTQGGNRLTHFTDRLPAADVPQGIQSRHSESDTTAESSPAMQVLNRYLIAESPDGVLVIDQHALHERILYEEIRTKVLAKAVETQALLVPEPVDLSPAEAASVLEQTELLEQLGIRVEAFGGDTVLISSYPAMLANWSPAKLLRTVAEQLTSAGKAPERRDLLDELLHMISCKAAIKAGDRLSPTEVEALLQQRELARDAHHCPHGRPTALVFTREELDKRFKRT